jgi:hypothetical protein
MNLRDLVEAINNAAENLPDGLDSRVEVAICNGHDSAGLVTRVATVETDPGGGRGTGSVFVVRGHPHDDPEAKAIRPAAMGADDALRRWTDESRLDPTSVLGPDDVPVREVLDDAGVTWLELPGSRVGWRMRFRVDGGRPLLPGAARAIAYGCTCDPTKNDGGRGAGEDGQANRVFIYKRGCPVHQELPPD